MVFSSTFFLFVFLPVALALYYLVPSRLRLLSLTLTSYFFYAWNDPRFLLLLLWITVADFTFANLISGHWRLIRGPPRPPTRVLSKTLLLLSIFNTLGLLLLFKYAGFAQNLFNALRASLNYPAASVISFVLPAGISFYIFESISYVVDVYRGIAQPASIAFVAALPESRRSSLFARLGAELRAFTAFACYLSQFPHLVAGPIIRYQELEPTLLKPNISADRFATGVVFLCFGLAAKVLIADTLAPVVELAFYGGPLSPLDAWWGIFAFTFQIYFDFTGYSTIAIGLALMLGFEFPVNFNAPYTATSITDFWRRWHISLSTWLRDYLYIPLGGNRKGRTRTYLNLILTMLLGGLWHGAALNFILWGLFHGVFLALERAIHSKSSPRSSPASSLLTSFRIALTFLIVAMGWVLFRVESLSHAAIYFTNLAGLSHAHTPRDFQSGLYNTPAIMAMTAAALLSFSGFEAIRVRLSIPSTLVAFLLFIFSVVILSFRNSTPFLYFKF